jgi:hypothetical protein
VRVLAQLCEQLGEPLESLELKLAEALPLLEQPLVVAPFQEVAGVGLDGIPERRESISRGRGRRSGERLLECVDVEPEIGVRPPAERPLSNFEVAVGVGKSPPEVVENVAEVRPSLRLGRVGPEEEGEALARLGRISVEQEIGEERFRAGRLEPGQRGPAQPELQLAEEPDLERRRIRGPSLAEPGFRGRRRRADIPGPPSHVRRMFAAWGCDGKGVAGRRRAISR